MGAPVKTKTTRPAGKVLCRVFWDRRDVLYVDILYTQRTISAAYYTNLLKTRETRLSAETEDLIKKLFNFILFLLPNEKKELILEFHPREPVAYCIYLPYILNGILGPPELNRPTSIKCSEYLSASEDLQSCKRREVNVTSKLNTLKILCAAGKNWISFSTLIIEFFRHEEHVKTMSIINRTENELEVMLKIDDIKTYMISVNERDYYITKDFLKVTMKAEESMTLTVEFSPENYGVYTEQVPIYVTNYSAAIPYNYLKLVGNNTRPILTIDKTIIYFPPVKLRTQIQETITVEMTDHECGGSTLQTHNEENYVSIRFNELKQLSESTTQVSFKITFLALEECRVECLISISCSCDAHASVLVNCCASSSIVINFLSDPAILQYSTYPYYPEDKDKSPYAATMFSIKSLLERWLFGQGFLFQNHYAIPDDISRYPVETSDTSKKRSVGRKKKSTQLPLVQLLLNLMDTSILKYIDNGISPSESLIEGTMYNYTTYRNVISFLKSQQIIVPGLRPEHLLRYSEYVTFKTKFIDKSKPVEVEESFTEDRFRLFSKQRWFDLLFHIYKVLVLERITIPNFNQDKNQCEYILQLNENLQEYYNRNKHRLNRSEPETKLLLWAEYHYNKQKTILWPQERFSKNQSVRSFKDFYTSVLFITLTSAYCPYMRNKLNNVYPFPQNHEHLIHNACRLLQIWSSLNFSIDVFPQTIVAGNEVKILIIVAYLYEVLPNCYPSTEINIDTPLSDSASCDITVQNCGNASIQYQAIFFENDFNLFELDTKVINILPGKNKKVKLKFFAKMVLPISSILLLSGESVGQRYAKSQVIIINGIPNVNDCEEIAVQVPTYIQITKKFSIKTPYGQNYTAKICMCFDKIKSKQDLISISTVRSRRLLREFTVEQTNCEFIDKVYKKAVQKWYKRPAIKIKILLTISDFLPSSVSPKPNKTTDWKLFQHELQQTGGPIPSVNSPDDLLVHSRYPNSRRQKKKELIRYKNRLARRARATQDPEDRVKAWNEGKCESFLQNLDNPTAPYDIWRATKSIMAKNSNAIASLKADNQMKCNRSLAPPQQTVSIINNIIPFLKRKNPNPISASFEEHSLLVMRPSALDKTWTAGSNDQPKSSTLSARRIESDSIQNVSPSSLPLWRTGVV
ncbi:uncharacterized protein LOC143203166 [Rhynchophorus ferrugineus]|uniref:uncharacterized protein LOC143203166 n=1 Tax=Rhynchophorus ferrugineus TaxID=354439 RepID=UPI003FCE3A41